jgi:hypothetical protein
MTRDGLSPAETVHTSSWAYAKDRGEFFGSCDILVTPSIAPAPPRNPMCVFTSASRRSATITVLMPTAVDLLHTLATTPDLPGAACTSHRDVFDACTDRRARFTYRRAIRICAACPVLLQCSAWISSLPPAERPFGVTAGRIRRRCER